MLNGMVLFSPEALKPIRELIIAYAASGLKREGEQRGGSEPNTLYGGILKMGNTFRSYRSTGFSQPARLKDFMVFCWATWLACHSSIHPAAQIFIAIDWMSSHSNTFFIQGWIYHIDPWNCHFFGLNSHDFALWLSENHKCRTNRIAAVLFFVHWCWNWNRWVEKGGRCCWTKCCQPQMKTFFFIGSSPLNVILAWKSL